MVVVLYTFTQSAVLLLAVLLAFGCGHNQGDTTIGGTAAEAMYGVAGWSDAPPIKREREENEGSLGRQSNGNTVLLVYSQSNT